MTDEASMEAAGVTPGSPVAPMPNAADKPSALPPAAMPEAIPDTPPDVTFAIRRVSPATAAERQAREEGMARALRNGARLYRDGDGQPRFLFFKEVNTAPVEPWVRDPRNKRRYRRVQEVRKAAGQLVGQPGDMIEIAKRLGVLHWEQGSDIEGAAERGLKDAIWSREHVYETFTVPRRYGRSLMETGRIAAVAEEEARRLQAEDPTARGGFWVRDRQNFGLVYVVPNPDLKGEEVGVIFGGDGEDALLGQASTPASPPPPKPAAPAQALQASPAPGQSATSSQANPAPAPATADDYFKLLRQGLTPREGGLANRPAHADPGGITLKGISQKFLNLIHQNKSQQYGHYPKSADQLTDDQIDTLLRKEMFDPLHLWEIAQVPDLLKLAPQLPEQLFDIAVQHGVGFAGHVVQEALFEISGIDLRVMQNGKLDYDGVIGPATRNALAQAVAAGKIVALNNLIVDKRIAELNTKGHKVDNPGWFPRSESFRITPMRSTGGP